MVNVGGGALFLSGHMILFTPFLFRYSGGHRRCRHQSHLTIEHHGQNTYFCPGHESRNSFQRPEVEHGRWVCQCVRWSFWTSILFVPGPRPPTVNIKTNIVGQRLAARSKHLCWIVQWIFGSKQFSPALSGFSKYFLKSQFFDTFSSDRKNSILESVGLKSYNNEYQSFYRYKCPCIKRTRWYAVNKLRLTN